MTTRKLGAAAALLALLALAGCSATAADGPSVDDGPTRDEVVPTVASFDHGVAALPGSDELPAGFVLDFRCPGGEYCSPISDHDEVTLIASSAILPEVEEPELWGDTLSFSFLIAVYPDSDGAEEALESQRDSIADKTGDFDIAPERTENGFVAGERGFGEAGDIEITGWQGVQSQQTSVLTAPDDEPSAERQSARIAIVRDSALIVCNSQRSAADDENLAKTDCAEAVASYLDRLEKIDPADAPRVTTVSRLAAALPTESDLPAGHEESVRCPGDAPCDDERQDQDASLSVDLPLPEGVTPQGGDRERFIVAGGEWTENLWLRAYIQADEAAAQAAVAERASTYGELVGELDTAPKATESGYDFGIDGRGEVIDIAGEGWSGQLKLLEARLIHLDGRVGDPRFDIRGVVSGGDVLLDVDGSFTVQGRDQADAVGFVEAQIGGFFERLATAP